MALPDVRALPASTRGQAADHIRLLPDFDLPALPAFNDRPCPAHTSLEDGQAQYPPCRRCGIRFRKHQRVGIAWLYMRGRGLIADQVGTGKTAQAAGLLACMRQHGEISATRPAVVVCRPAAQPQWVTELRRFLPGFAVVDGTGTKLQRSRTYRSAFDVVVIGHQMFLRDHEHLDATDVSALIVDDVDELRSHATQTAYVLKRLAARTDRVVILTGTPLQKRLQELHSLCEALGGYEVFGSMTRFKKRYLREELGKVYNARIGRSVVVKHVTGYQNLDDFKQKFTPFTLRRTPEHITDVDLPVISPHDVYLDLHPRQRERYELLRSGVAELLHEEGNLTVTKAGNAFTLGQQICAGLVNVGEPDTKGTSVKLDWLEHQLTDGDLGDEKVVVFVHFQKTVEAVLARLLRREVGTAVIWGRDTNKTHRAQAIARFWDEPGCRVLVGTDAIEQSLNLQVSRHLVNVDQLMNPARMTQLAGRIRRDGSPFQTVYVHNLLCRDTQEEGYIDALAREQALADHVWDEQSQLYQKLDPLTLLHLIGRTTR